MNIRLEEHKLCLLVMIGVRAGGRKELIALADGYRESAESRADLLRDCARRGMRAPVLAVGDGPWGSGARCGKSSPRPARAGAGSTRSPTCSPRCRSPPAPDGQVPSSRGLPGPRHAPPLDRAEHARQQPRFVHAFVHETRWDRLRRGRRGETRDESRSRPPRSARRPETTRDGRDARRMAHNHRSRVQVPPPLLSSRSEASSIMEEAFGCPMLTGPG